MNDLQDQHQRIELEVRVREGGACSPVRVKKAQSRTHRSLGSAECHSQERLLWGLGGTGNVGSGSKEF